MKSYRRKNKGIIVSVWLRGIDSNYRPLGYEPNELPTAPPRDILFSTFNKYVSHYNTF